MNLNDFSKAKVGDVVTCAVYGEGKIHHIDTDIYPISVDFTNTTKWYTTDGRLDEDANPTLFKNKTQTEIIVKKAAPYQENELILVRDSETAPWKVAKFVSMTPVNNVYARFIGTLTAAEHSFNYHCSLRDFDEK